jgi:hypothetical protein
MKIQLIIIVMLMGLLTGCDSRKLEVARHTIDSLDAIVKSNQKMNKTLGEIGVLMDSIDASRKVLRTNMIEGVHYKAYVRRMSELNQYVRRTERKLAALQKQAKLRKDFAYSAVVKGLKASLEAKNLELAALREQLQHYRLENEELISTVSLQKAELQDKLIQLKNKQEETAQLESQVNRLIEQMKVDQGEALYAQASAVEETARRTKFAPKKKKSSQRQALELYKQALLFGKSEAQERITALEKM